MEAKIIERAEVAPAQCAITADIDGPFIDTGTYCQHVDPYIYLHVPLVEQYARDLLGMVPRAEVDALEQRLADQDKAIEELRELLDDLKQVEAIEQKLVAA